VDFLVKKEFDSYREKNIMPPVFAGLHLDAKLYTGADLALWRNNFKGISYADENLNATLYGAVDDILVFSDTSLAVVDYKSSGSKEITIYDDYRKQMDTYNYILQNMGYATQSQAYFVFFRVQKDREAFNNVLEFEPSVRAIDVDVSWVGPAFERAIGTARQTTPPPSSPECNHCNYVHGVCKHAEPFVHDTQSDKDYMIMNEE
jgi:hypothetical protein